MPVFYKKDDHILIQTDSYEDWRSFFNCCDGYLMETFAKPSLFVISTAGEILTDLNH